MAGNHHSYWTPDGKTVSLTAQERKELAAAIRAKIERFQLTYVWLISRLSDEGLLTDKHELSATLSCSRIGPKADKILRLSLSILDTYESTFMAAKIT